jgi:hypothetical protein
VSGKDFDTYKSNTNKSGKTISRNKGAECASDAKCGKCKELSKPRI